MRRCTFTGKNFMAVLTVLIVETEHMPETKKPNLNRDFWRMHDELEREALSRHSGATASYYFEDKKKRSICRIQTCPEGLYLDFKYKEGGIRPRNVFLAGGNVIDLIKELEKEDILFVVGEGGIYLLWVLFSINQIYEEGTTAVAGYTYPPKVKYHELGYKIGQRGCILSVDGFTISANKHAYVCRKCGAVFQSKNVEVRSIFRTNDMRCGSCVHGVEDLERVCDCDPSVTWDFNKEGVFCTY